MSAFQRFFFVLALSLTGSFWVATPLQAEEKPGGQLKFGRWVGYLKPDTSKDAIAVTMDSFYQVKYEALQTVQYDVLQFRLGLGGYLGTEYESETFENFQFDIDQGLLSLNDPHNEMVVTAYIYSKPTLHIEGRVYFRTSATYATLYVEYQTGKPSTAPPHPTPPLIPALAGQYEGTCAGEKVVLQLETGKGLTLEVPVPTAGLTHYNITGTLGAVNGLCPRVNPPDRPKWCVDHAFSSGTYDFFNGKLYLAGTHESDECTRDGENFNCRMRFLPKEHVGRDLVEASCNFHKVNSVVSDFKVYRRQFHLAASADQKKPFPKPEPPLSKAQVAAGTGSFYGFLHNEYLDRYMPLRLDATATATTPHPHIPNNVFVSLTSVLFFGDGKSSSFSAQQFDSHVLYLVVPGYLLKSDSSDAFLEVTEWKQGYIAGNWFSSHFGKVGTFEVVKGDGFPQIDPSAKLMPDIAGHFRGDEERSNGGKDFWDLRLLVPKQPRSAEISYLVFQGNYQLYYDGYSVPGVKRIQQGAYDFYTGGLAWMTDDAPTGEMKLVTGLIQTSDVLKLYWPSDRVPFAAGILDHNLGTYRRVSE